MISVNIKLSGFYDISFLGWNTLFPGHLLFWVKKFNDVSEFYKDKEEIEKYIAIDEFIIIQDENSEPI